MVKHCIYHIPPLAHIPPSGSLSHYPTQLAKLVAVYRVTRPCVSDTIDATNAIPPCIPGSAVHHVLVDVSRLASTTVPVLYCTYMYSSSTCTVPPGIQG